MIDTKSFPVYLDHSKFTPISADMSNNSKDRSKGRESVDSKDNSELWKDAEEKRKLKIAKAEAKRTAQEKTLVAQNVGDKHSEILDENRQIREGLKKITSSDNHDPSGGLLSRMHTFMESSKTHKFICKTPTEQNNQVPPRIT